ncbi:MAG TPA: glycosyltransferase [Arenimonas sp.]|nr:glycosyltransferase [Arenimonas sp.]
MNRRRLTVVQLLPALHSGGVERSTLEIGRALVAAGHRSIVVSAGGRLVERLRAEGSEHVELDIGGKSLRTLFRLPALRALLRGLRPDVVHARSRLPAWLARFALPSGAHFVTSVHGLNSPGRYSAILTRGERVICVSETVRRHVLQQWPHTDPARLCVISRGIDSAEFPRGFEPGEAWRSQWATEHPLLAGGRLLLLPGRGTRLKGHADALRLLADLRASGIDARLWLLGADEPGRERYLDELRALARQLQVSPFLVIDPPRADVRAAYAISDLVLQLSRKPEAFGRTVLEALAVGRPVLGWAHGGVGELLSTHYPQGAVALGDTAGLLASARRLLSDAPAPPALGDGLAAMQSATLALYESLLDA